MSSHLLPIELPGETQACLGQEHRGWADSKALGLEGSTSKINRQCSTAGRAGLRRGTRLLQGAAAAGTGDGCESLSFTRCLVGFCAVLVKQSKEQYDWYYQLINQLEERGLVEEKKLQEPFTPIGWVTRTVHTSSALVSIFFFCTSKAPALFPKFTPRNKIWRKGTA